MEIPDNQFSKKYDLDKEPKNYFELWKYFTDKVETYKDKPPGASL